MALRLANRNQGIPNGFLYHQRQTNWRSWEAQPATMWDFKLLCREVQKHRQLNPRFKLNTDMIAIANEVDRVNAERMATIPNAQSYYVGDSPGPASPNPTLPPPSNLLLDVAGAKLHKIATGLGIIRDWDESNDPAVPSALAESRATTCVNCKLNGKGDFTRWFTVPASEQIRKQMARKSARNLTTSKDELLGVCEGCLCPLRLKVWTPISFIANRLTDETKKDLDPGCWVLSETK